MEYKERKATMMNQKRTIHKQYTLRILSFMLGIMAFSMAAVL